MEREDDDDLSTKQEGGGEAAAAIEVVDEDDEGCSKDSDGDDGAASVSALSGGPYSFIRRLLNTSSTSLSSLVNVAASTFQPAAADVVRGKISRFWCVMI